MEKKIINLYPSENWNDTTPVGNGTLGASVYGCVYDERILINHEALYNWVCDAGYPDISYALKEVRDLMDEGKYKEANTYYTDIIKNTGFKSNKGKFFPAFDIHMIFDTDGAPNDYRRELDMETGVCTVSYTENQEKCTRTVFASQRDRVIVVNLKKTAPFSVKISLERHDMADYVDNFYCDEFSTFAKNEYIYSDSKTGGKLHFTGMIKVLNTDGEIDTNINDKKLKIDMSGDVILKDCIKISNATDITLIFTLNKDSDSFENMKREADRITKGFDQLLNEQKKDFSALFNRTRLNLTSKENQSCEQLFLDSYQGNVDGRFIEKMADFGRYLLISSSVGCEYPANLQGLWNGAYSPAWACTFFNNENIQMAYWQTYAGNLKEAVLPLFNLYEKFMDDYRENAKNLFGCRGILLPLFMDNSNGKKENIQPHVLYWTGSSAWISAIYYDYYLYTGDVDFLRNRAYPFMKEAAQFYEDFLVYDENGKVKFYPSNSPENRPDGDFEGAKEISVSINSTMDFALLKELLTNLLEARDVLDVDSEKEEDWRGILKNIPEYEINGDGAVKEWMHPDFKDNYHHRHQSHIYPLFPGLEVNEDNNKELFDAMEVAVNKRLVIGLKSQTGWSLAHMANIFARLNNGEKAKECLDLLIRFCTGKNLYTYHNDWRNMGVTLKFLHAGHAPYQVDANMGFVSAVYEMLLYSDRDKIRLLPALPKQFKEGSIENIQARGGFDVSIYWSETEVYVKIKSLLGKNVNVGIKGYTLVTDSSKLKDSKYGENYKLLTLSKGETVELEYKKA